MTESKTKIITESKDAVKKDIDTTEIKADEHFNYLGKKYVKKLKYYNKFDDEGKPVWRHKIHMDGFREIVGMEKSAPVQELWGVIEDKTDTPTVLKKYGKPLTTQIRIYGPLDSGDLFKYENEPITYDNLDFKDEVLVRKGTKIIRKEK